MEWQLWARRFLEALMGQPGRIERHPPLSGDEDERDLERERFERETRHVGSTVDTEPPPPPPPDDQRPSAH